MASHPPTFPVRLITLEDVHVLLISFLHRPILIELYRCASQKRRRPWGRSAGGDRRQIRRR
jgi:hypothetical protein